MSARALEQRAGLPTMTVRGIMDNAHPRTERFEKLLAAIPSLEHRCQLLIAYVLDDAPDSHCQALEQILNEHLLAWHQAKGEADGLVQAIAPVGYKAQRSNATIAREVLEAMRQAIDSGDSELAAWLAITGSLLTSSHLASPTEGT